MSIEYNESLGAERVTRHLINARGRLKERLLYGAKQLMQSGYPLGASNMGSKLDALQQYRMNHGRNLQILNSNSYEGDKIRAERQLLEEERLLQEVFGELS